MQDAAHQAAVRRGQFLTEVGFGIGELAKKTDTRDDVGAVWSPVEMLSDPGERAWQRMTVGWIASRLVRGLFIVFPGGKTAPGLPNLLRIWRSALKVRCPR